MFKFIKNWRKKKKEKSLIPTHWCLGHDFKPQLGFDDGTYLPREAGKIFHPEYFDKNGEPKMDMLPLDGQKRRSNK